jgi:hypothetical protein
MRGVSKRAFAVILVLFIVISAVMAQAVREDVRLETEVSSLEPDRFTTKHGNLVTAASAKEFVRRGFEWGDVVTVSFLDKVLELPVVPAYTYVETGSAAVVMKKDDSGKATGYIILAINMGDFTTTYGIASKTTNEDKTWFWTASDGVSFPVKVVFEMSEKGGFLAECLAYDLVRTNNREDYASLSDEQFANFRMVDTTGMHGKLYRSSNPVNAALGRNTQADEACRAAGITMALNLVDNRSDAQQRPEFAGSFYSTIDVKYLSLGLDFASSEFGSGLAEGLASMADDPGIYLIHCKEGKDRAGFVCAVLECLMGASAAEVVEDYMETFFNYYGVGKGSYEYDAIAQGNIIKTLKTAFGISDLNDADLAACAQDYLLSIGMSSDEISRLKANL